MYLDYDFVVFKSVVMGGRYYFGFIDQVDKGSPLFAYNIETLARCLNAEAKLSGKRRLLKMDLKPPAKIKDYKSEPLDSDEVSELKIRLKAFGVTVWTEG